MTAITAERRPGGFVHVSGLLAHSAAVEEIAALLVDPDALDLALKVARANESYRDTPTLRAMDACDDALAELAGHLASTTFTFRTRDLAPVADAVAERVSEVVA